MSEQQKKIIRAKAAVAGISVNRFILASALGSDYHPPADPELTRALLRLNRELTAQGNNLNQIARCLNAGQALPVYSAMLEALASSLRRIHGDIRRALVAGKANAEP